MPTNLPPPTVQPRPCYWAMFRRTAFRLTLLLTSLCWLPPYALQAQSFTDIGANLTGVQQGSVAWGDYDNDGDLDILLSGSTGSRITRVYRNDQGSFTDIGANLTGVDYGSVAWGDYDNDGDLDILLSGLTGGGISRIYRNDNGSFTNINAGLPGVYNSSVAWGDYDNDGDLDILLSGFNGGGGRITRIYRNDQGSFTDINANLPGVEVSSVAWGDYDNDGDLDILLTGNTGNGFISLIYRNDQGSFTDINAGLTGVYRSSVAWGDYDNDGDLDILLSGSTGSGVLTRIYRNDQGSFTDIGANLPGIQLGSVAWGDYDNDGDLDILLSGSTGSSFISLIYRNDQGSFTDINANLTAVLFSSVAWGDYDNDSDLDILLTGYEGSGITRIYRNDGSVFNTAPTAPTGLSASLSGQDVTLSWNPATDSKTPANGLSYNLYLGTSPQGIGTLSPQSNIGNGYRRVVALGNGQTGTTFTLKNLPVGTYYWSVQAVDAAFAGSAFATEGSFTVLSFTDIGANLLGVQQGSVAWGDYDNDGDLDFLLTGSSISGNSISLVYRNDQGSFTDLQANLPGVQQGSVAWGDYDNDGDLDILLTGLNGSNAISRVYRNDQGSFTDINAGLTGVLYSSVAWGDYDNDGDLDVLLTGNTGGNSISRVYRNDQGSFTDIGANLPDVYLSSVAWGDYDNDGDLDILLTGYNGGGIGGITSVYRNDQGSFTDINAGLPGVYYSSVAWGDYDNDGDLDILLTGNTNGGSSGGISRVYRNDQGSFTDINAGLPGVYHSSVAWGDYDNDGDLDILLTGNTNGGSSGGISRVYRNGQGSFTDINAGLPGVSSGSVAWGDYDNDGDLDILLTGRTGGNISQVYRTDGSVVNTAPTAPTGLSASLSGQEVTLSWNPASDTQTPADGLSYNLYLGTSPQSVDKVSPQSNLANGYRKIVALGNGQTGTNFKLNNLPAGTYYWSVQAVDATFAGSPFATQASFSLSTNTTTSLAKATTTYGSTSVNLVATVDPVPTGGSVAFFLKDYPSTGTNTSLGTATKGADDHYTLTYNPSALSVGSYPILAAYSGLAPYAASNGSETLSVGTKPLTITAKSTTKTYGQTIPFAGTEFTSSVLLNRDTISSVTLTSAGAAATAPVSGSPYAIVPSAAQGSGLANYAIGYVNGILSVNQASLTAKAEDKNRTFGAPNPPLTIHYDGFVNNEDPTVLDSEPVAATTAVANSPVGEYPITLSGGTDDNYALLLQDGTLTVGDCPSITLTPANLPDATINTFYSQSLTAEGGSGAYIFSVASGSFPDWLTLTVDGVLSGTPPTDGTVSFTLQASDVNTCRGSQTYSLTVLPLPNHPPVVANAIPNQAARVNTPFSFSFAANTFSDSDGNALTYSAVLSGNVALPSWLNFNANTRTFSGTPPSTSGSPFTIQVTASDGSLPVSTPFTLTVNPAPSGAQVVSFTLVNANTDQDIQPLTNGATLNLATLPTKNLNIRANTTPTTIGSVVFNLSGKQSRTATEGTVPYALFGDTNGNYDAWVPAVGSYSLKATPFSAAAGTALTIAFSVINQNTTNHPPVVAHAIPNQTARVNAPFSFSFAANTFSDSDGNPLTYSAVLSGNTALPAWLSFQAASRTFSGTPPNTTGSPFTIKVTASDGSLTVSTTFTLTVNPAPSGPQVVSFTLVNADTDQDLQTLTNGATLNLASLSTRNLNIRVNTSPAQVAKVVFNLSGKQSRTATEGQAPYALFGDTNGNYHAWVPAVGSYSLKATPFSAAAGTALTISFSVINQAARLAVGEVTDVAMQLVAYPNPTTTGQVKVALSQELTGAVSYQLVYQTGVMMTSGQLILSKPSSVLCFDFSDPMRVAGVYYLRLEGGQLKGMLKLQRQ